MNNNNSLIILIVDKLGEIKKLNVKNFNYEELYKKCGFKKADNFEKIYIWNFNFENDNYNILLYGKTIGRSNYENKYKLPFPLNNLILYGSFSIVCEIFNKELNIFKNYNLNLELWEKMYNYLLNNYEFNNSINLNNENKEIEKNNKSKENKNEEKINKIKDNFIENEINDIINENKNEIYEETNYTELEEEEYNYS